MREMSTQEAQEVIREELEMFWALCEEHGLRPFLLGGTALGAVRGEGFIPWDDDGDVGLERDDYQRFLQIFRDDERYELYEMNRTPGYNCPFAKISDKRTLFVMPEDTGLDQLGVYLDVFCLDPMTPSPLRQRGAAALARAYRLAFFARRTAEDFARGSLPKRVARRAILAAANILGRKRLLSLVEALGTAGESELVGNIWGAHEMRETVPRTWFGEGTQARFEGATYRIPADFERYFTSLYGPDWRTPRQDAGAVHGQAYWRD